MYTLSNQPEYRGEPKVLGKYRSKTNTIQGQSLPEQVLIWNPVLGDDNNTGGKVYRLSALLIKLIKQSGGHTGTKRALVCPIR